jgi:hypothetical protein
MLENHTQPRLPIKINPPFKTSPKRGKERGEQTNEKGPISYPQKKKEKNTDIADPPPS